jgi:hypothetical protein
MRAKPKKKKGQRGMKYVKRGKTGPESERAAK